MSSPGRFTPGFGSGDLRIVPLRDRAEVNSGERLLGEVQFAGNAGNVVGGNHGAENGGEMQNLEFSTCRELLVAHRAVRGAEIHGACCSCANSAARADGLIVDLHVRVGRVIHVKPLRVDRDRERGACGIQKYRCTVRPQQPPAASRNDTSRGSSSSLSWTLLYSHFLRYCYGIVTSRRIRGEIGRSREVGGAVYGGVVATAPRDAGNEAVSAAAHPQGNAAGYCVPTRSLERPAARRANRRPCRTLETSGKRAV